MEKERKFLHGFIKYTPTGKIVPGSLIITPNRPHPGIWNQVVIDLCCDKFGPTTNTKQRAFVKYDTKNKIVPGSLVIGKHLPKPGRWKEVSINLCCDVTPIITTTTTTTIAPTGWYLRSNYPDAPNNGDITFPDFTNGVATFNPNNVGNGDVAMIINRYDISGNPTIPDLTGLTNNLNTGTLTLSQGSNTIVYSFDGFSFIVTGGLNQIEIYYINVDSPASGDFNLIDPIDVSVNINFATTTSTTTAAPIPSVSICAVNWTNINLDVTVFRNGTVIPEITNSTNWKNATSPGWCYYNYDAANASYGKIYNHYAINSVNNLAPVGYHIPNLTEWNTLINCVDVGGVGLPLIEIGTTHWLSPTGTNTTGFTALGGGIHDVNGVASGLKSLISFGCYNATEVINMFNNGFIAQVPTPPYSGGYIRLIKD